MRIPALLHVGTTSLGTGSNTTETDLQTYTLPANALAIDNRGVRIRAWGDTGGNGNTKTIRLYFGASVVQSNTTTTAPNNVDWVIDASIFRYAGNSQTFHSVMHVGTALQAVVSSILTTADNATITIKVTGQNGTASSSDIICRGMTVEAL